MTVDTSTLVTRSQITITESDCSGCGTCLVICPKRAIVKGPVFLEWLSSACIFCDACIDLCPTGAISETRIN
ncbi:MAG: 4Fe-4S binding protein [Acidimicrobiales bacterium]|nr:4Fe-4S binding protein [Acidimicrobiales bacterium]